MLERIALDLQDSWNDQKEEFIRRINLAGIQCVSCEEGDIFHTLLLTDDQKKAGNWKKQGGICVGLYKGNGYFEGAELVTDTLKELDKAILEETLLHGLGLPVTVAQTQRLIIKEITEKDVEKLYQISLQEGMQHLMENRDGDNCFEPERMRSYIKNVYRYYGYGLWSVWTKDGELIGCCGLSDFEDETKAVSGVCSQDQNAEDYPILLEMQYMLDNAYRGCGYGTEMCRAVLQYAFSRTDQNGIILRIHKDNKGSLSLAKKLGFVCVAEYKELIWYLLKK